MEYPLITRSYPVLYLSFNATMCQVWDCSKLIRMRTVCDDLTFRELCNQLCPVEYARVLVGEGGVPGYAVFQKCYLLRKPLNIEYWDIVVNKIK